jgi:hypothetical protein
MSQRNITHVGKPEKRYRVDLGANAVRSGFERLEHSQKEDLLRAKQLRNAARWFPDVIDEEAASTLAAKLETAGNGGKVPESLACSTYMRSQRINVSGALWKLIKEAGR